MDAVIPRILHHTPIPSALEPIFGLHDGPSTLFSGLSGALLPFALFVAGWVVLTGWVVLHAWVQKKSDTLSIEVNHG